MRNLYPLFKLDALNGLMLVAIGLFSILILIYSSGFMKGKKGLFQYYTYLILTAIISILAVLSNHLILLSVFWGFLGLTLYLLINMGDENSNLVAKKTFIIVGGSDALMLLGIGIMYYLTGTFQMERIKIPLTDQLISLSTLAYLCLTSAAFAKAGAMPFHSWIPESAESAPLPVVAYLPASLDKLLGIYLLARASLDLFVVNGTIRVFLMLVGAVTVIAAVMMALVQHNMKRLLGYHAVSQVGYMVLGIGTANPVGIAGGIFHMLNHSIYKQALFLISGNVENKTGTTNLDKLGGLSRLMPLTYICALIASLSISGLPPFNGFVSKWMVYQGLIDQFQASSLPFQFISVFSLTAAMFGSGLTLASFMKLLYATFLGKHLNALTLKNLKEVSWTMWFPPLFLAILCVIFGIFANQLPLKYLILPAVGETNLGGSGYAGLATLLVVGGLLLGILIFTLRGLKPLLRQDASYTGAETRALAETGITGTDFFNTIKELRLMQVIYKKLEAGLLDIYAQGKKIIFFLSGIFQYLHNGVLPTYLVWCLLGMMGFFWILLK